MKELTLKIDFAQYFNDDLENYLLTLDGVKQSKIDKENEEIYIEYDSNVISLKLLKLEILLYLDLKEMPTFVSFNKHEKENLQEYTIIIDCLCCEYCLKGMIEDLLEIEGINSAYSDYDYGDNHNVPIYITYNNKIIDKEKLEKITKDFNYE